MRQTPDNIWLEILENLDDTARQDVYLRQVIPLSITSDALRIAVPSVYTHDRIERRFRTAIQSVLATLIGAQCMLIITVDESVSDIPEQVENPESEINQQVETGLNRNYVFDRFVVGSSNRICHATALMVSENPGREYNPLFIYGGVGLGKTHLLHAIGNRISANYPEKKVLYVTSETFMNEYVESIMKRTSAEGFRVKYRRADMLLIDDIQFLQRKEGTQEEFFNTFNDLYLNSNQIVMTSDRSPDTLENLEERLKSRFEWGMVSKIEMPEYETRLGILRQKCEDQGLDNMSDDVLSYVAEIVTTNIRELEGMLVRLIAQSTILKEELNVDFARQVLNDVASPALIPQRKTATAKGIQTVVSEYFGVDAAELVSEKRTKELVLPRQIAMYLCREMTQMSFANIAQAFNKQNHTTIIHACTRTEELIKKDNETREMIDVLMAQLR